MKKNTKREKKFFCFLFPLFLKMKLISKPCKKKKQRKFKFLNRKKIETKGFWGGQKSL